MNPERMPKNDLMRLDGTAINLAIKGGVLLASADHPHYSKDDKISFERFYLVVNKSEIVVNGHEIRELILACLETNDQLCMERYRKNKHRYPVTVRNDGDDRGANERTLYCREEGGFHVRDNTIFDTTTLLVVTPDDSGLIFYKKGFRPDYTEHGLSNRANSKAPRGNRTRGPTTTYDIQDLENP